MKRKILISIITLFCCFHSTYTQTKGTMSKDNVRMGALANMVASIDIKDADAAFKIWTDSFIRRLKAKNVYDFVFEYKMYEDVVSLKNDINNNTINYFNVSTDVYFDLNTDNNFVPFLSGINYNTENFIHYILITSSSNKNTNLDQLVNKKINISKQVSKSFGIYWLKVLLRDSLGTKDFKSIIFSTINQNENEDLLAVYFNKADYALVSEGAFNLSCELNPSIKNKIKILAKSEPVVNGVFVYRKGMKKSTINAIRDIAINIHNDNEGRQILNLFKIERIIPITSKDLEACEKIVIKYNNYFK